MTDAGDHAVRGGPSKSRGWSSAGMGLAGAVILVVIVSVIARWSDPSKPSWNVLLITIDTTRADRLGCYGYGSAETPAIDALSREGVRYQRCYSPVPLTLPSHCSLMTGLYPPRHGIRDNGRDALSDNAETLAEILGQNGYATGAVVGAFVLDSQFGLAQGFEYYNDETQDQADLFHFAERNAELVTDAAISWWSDHRQRKKFLWVHYFDPHSPYLPPGFDPNFSIRTGYDAEISFVDSQLKRLLAAIETDSDQECLTVLTSDHGEGLSQHGETTHGLFTYNTTLRVPLIVRFPDRRHAGKTLTTPVSLVDILPSMLQWLGTEFPDDLDGIQLPFDPTASTTPQEEHRVIYYENYASVYSYGWSPLIGIIAGDDKLIQAPRPEFYRLNEDPHEEDDRYNVSDSRILRMHERLEEFLVELHQRRALPNEGISISDEDLAKLRSLGYVGDTSESNTVNTAPIADGPDPKDMIEVFLDIQKAQGQINGGHTEEAVDRLIDVLNTKDPGNRRAALLLASFIPTEPNLRPRIVDCLMECGKLGGPISDEADALTNLGNGLVEEKRDVEAVTIFEQLLVIQPNKAIAYRHLGEALERLGKPSEAQQAYRRAADLVAHLEEPPEWLDQVRDQVEKLQAARGN